MYRETFGYLAIQVYTLIYLVKVVESFVKIGHHASWRFIGDLDGGFKDTLRNVVSRSVSSRLCGHVHSVILMATFTRLLQLFVKLSKPLSNKMDVL